MTIASLKGELLEDAIIRSIFAYRQAVREHIYRIRDDISREELVRRISEERMDRFDELLKDLSIEGFVDEVISCMLAGYPAATLLPDYDIRRAAFWNAETMLQLMISAHHAIFEGYCKELQDRDRNRSRRRKSE